MNNHNYVTMRIDPLFAFRFAIQQTFEKRSDDERLKAITPKWENVKGLSDEYLESKLQSFAKKMEIEVIGTHELKYLANKVLDELVKDKNTQNK